MFHVKWILNEECGSIFKMTFTEIDEAKFNYYKQIQDIESCFHVNLWHETEKFSSPCASIWKQKKIIIPNNDRIFLNITYQIHYYE